MAYQHVKGGVCFKCNGLGYVLVSTSPETLKKQAEKRKAKREGERAAREAAAQARWLELQEKYRADLRIGPKCRQSCERSETYAYEVYTTLDAVDSGLYSHGIESLPNITE